MSQNIRVIMKNVISIEVCAKWRYYIVRIGALMNNSGQSAV